MASGSLLVGPFGGGEDDARERPGPRGDAGRGRGARGRGKGRHTTSSAEAHRLEDGTVLVDTAGIREFALWNVDWRGVEAGFPEIFHEAEHCRFADCRHLSEPGCAVLLAVEEERISSERFASYLTLVTEVERKDRD